jgi:DNA topoisomerase IB
MFVVLNLQHHDDPPFFLFSSQRDGTKITSFADCDFRPMFEHFEAEKAKKKALSTAEKKEIKKAKDEAEAKYTTCLLDGRKEKVGNFRVEPPGLFRGRGDHPRKGALKVFRLISALVMATQSPPLNPISVPC